MCVCVCVCVCVCGNNNNNNVHLDNNIYNRRDITYLTLLYETTSSELETNLLLVLDATPLYGEMVDNYIVTLVLVLEKVGEAWPSGDVVGLEPIPVSKLVIYLTSV